MFGGKLGIPELLLLLGIALLIFGPGKLADFGKGLGEGIRSFKKGLNEDAEDDKSKPQLSEKKDDEGKKQEKEA